MLPRPEDLDELLATPLPRDPRRGASPAWEKATLWVVIGSIWFWALLHELDIVAIGIAAAMTGVVLLGSYFMSVDLTAPPSRTEVLLGRSWRVIRALVGITGALVFLGAPIVALVRGGFRMFDAVPAAIVVAGVLLGLICLRIGLFGKWRSIDALFKARHRAVPRAPNES